MTYLQGHNKSGLKVGDTVRVTRKAKDYERGWLCGWLKEMDSWVQKVGKIASADRVLGFRVEVPGSSHTWMFPYFVLEKVTPKRKSETPSLDKLCKKHGIKNLSAVLRDLADWVEGKE